MTIEPLKLGFTKDEFSAYCEKIVAPKITAWRPRGLVLHCTYRPRLKDWPGIVRGKPITAEQRIDNLWQSYREKGWYSGPHLFVAPDKIWCGTPLWMRGTHSPSFNAAYWSIELVGDYASVPPDVMPASLRYNAVHAAACLFAMLGHEPSPQNLKYHGEDPRTTHKSCPGNIGPKSQWEADIEKRMSELHPGEHFAA